MTYTTALDSCNNVGIPVAIAVSRVASQEFEEKIARRHDQYVVRVLLSLLFAHHVAQ